MTEPIPEALPPILEPPQMQEPSAKVARWRWGVHMALLTAFPVWIGLYGLRHLHRGGAALPTSTSGLVSVAVSSLIEFALLFGIACLFSRARPDQLLLRWRGRFAPIAWGFLASIALRILVAIAGIIVVLFLMAAGVITRESFTGRQGIAAAVDMDAISNNPVYLAVMLTFVSFVVAGLREELWRAGMLAGLTALFPAGMGRRWGQCLGVSAVAIVFGFAHFYMGWFGFLSATFIGFWLGALMVWRQSIWEATLAHGFFDAATFALLPLLSHLKSFAGAGNLA
jgi:membrane protease YdiL (CAAX protease family)